MILPTMKNCGEALPTNPLYTSDILIYQMQQSNQLGKPNVGHRHKKTVFTRRTD